METAKGEVIIALGSNISPEEHLREGLGHLRRWFHVTATSRVYRTPPWGYPDQPDFLNAAVAGQTELPPTELLDRLKDTEELMGRLHTIPNGPRTLDLDILFFGNLVIDSERLTLPHPRLHERGFVLLPLCDIAAEFIHPILGRTVSELLDAVDLDGIEPVDLVLPA